VNMKNYFLVKLDLTGSNVWWVQIRFCADIHYNQVLILNVHEVSWISLPSLPSISEPGKIENKSCSTVLHEVPVLVSLQVCTYTCTWLCVLTG
jgi:hypothetical protein